MSKKSIFIKVLIVLSSAALFKNNAAFSMTLKEEEQQKITVKANRVTLKEAFEIIEKVSAYIFVYQDEIIAKNAKVDLNEKDNDIKSVLKKILPKDIIYKISGRQIILQRRSESIVSANTDTPLRKKNVLIKGKVTNLRGEPVIGAYILIKDSKNGVIADLEGNYTIEIKDPDARLIFSALSYQNLEISINGRSTINVTMQDEINKLDEVVVIGYGTQTKATITGALSVVDTKKLVEAPVSSISNVLAGSVPGISSVQTSGQPGKDAASIYIRGTGSLSAELSAPLVLVDGIEREFSQIDPNEIENMSVLKDAASTAVFGVRGANGVILITTKRGKEGRMSINANSSTGIQQPIRLVEQVGSHEYAEFWNRKMHNDGVSDPSRLFSPEAIEAYRTGSDPIMYPNNNWTKMMCNNVFFQSKNNLNISGGDNFVNYFVSMGYLYQNGILKQLKELSYDNNYSYNRYNYRANVDLKLTNTTKFKMNIGGYIGMAQEPYSVVESLGNPWVYATIWANPMSGPGFINGVRTIIPKGFIPTDIELRDSYSCFYGYGYHKDYNATLNVDAEIEQKLDMVTKGLSLSIKGSYDNKFKLIKKRQSWGAEYQVAYYKSYLEDKTKKMTDPDYDKTILYVPEGSNYPLGYSEDYGRERSWYIETKLNWQRQFGAGNSHKISAMVLYNQSRNYYPTTFAYIPRSYIGYVGRATYSYRDKYYADINIGYNGSENFAPGKTRYGLFPSISLGWVLTGEKFMKNFNFVDYLKIRASYGRVGNDISSTRFLYIPETWTQSGSYSFGVDNAYGQEAYARRTPGNPEVTWETADKQNYGIDADFLDNRLSLSFDWFFEHRTGILITPNTIPSVIAKTLPAMNIGIVDNSGYEISLGWKDYLKNGFHYSFNGTVSFARNKIIYQDEISSNYSYQHFTGGPTGRYLLYRFERIYQYEDFTRDSNGELTLREDLPQPNFAVRPGDAMYADINGDNIVNSNDKEVTGYSTRPEYVFGLNCKLGYNGLNISAQWTGATNVNRLMAAGTYRIPFTNAGGRGLLKYFYDDCWSEDNRKGTLPRASRISESWNSEDSTLWLRDASYIRLKTLTISYTLNNFKAFPAAGANSATISFSGYNLFTLTPLKFMDPEAQPSNTSDYPLVKIYSLGLNLTF